MIQPIRSSTLYHTQSAPDFELKICRSYERYTVQVLSTTPFLRPLRFPIYGESGKRLTVRVTVSVLVTRLLAVTVAVLVVPATPLVIRQEQADEMAGGPRPREMLTWRLTGSSAGQAAS
jgi:hypothetical protein